jgi:hypothetical protein
VFLNVLNCFHFSKERLQRCDHDCQDRTKDKMGANLTDSEVKRT